MTVTDDADLAGRLRLLRVHGGAKQYHHDEIGINSRLDTLQAAVLLAKVGHLAEWAAGRRRHAAAYDEAFESLDAVAAPQVAVDNEHVYHQYTIRADHRDELRDHLKRNGIGCAVYYPTPLHLQPCFAELRKLSGEFPESERASREVLSLPVYPELQSSQRDIVIEAILGFYQ